MFHPIGIALAILLVSITPCSGATMDPFTFRSRVFTNGVDGYAVYRIPAVLALGDGRVLAFAEARRHSHEDTGDIDLVVKRSADGGRSWSPQQVVHAVDGAITIGNPCPILDADGTVHLLVTRDYHRSFYLRSDDGGASWSEPREITAAFHGFGYDWAIIATGPGHGIQLDSSRLVAPVWLCDRTRADRYQDVHDGRIRSGVVLSDDGGETWRAGGLTPTDVPLMHEATVATCRDGSLVINTRAWRAGARAVSHSLDDGETWATPSLDHQLPDPVCQGSLLTLADGDLAFTNPAVTSNEAYHSSARRRLTLRRSSDDGTSWSAGLVIEPGPSGYSDLTQRDDGTVLCLFEHGEEVYREAIDVVGIAVEDIPADN